MNFVLRKFLCLFVFSFCIYTSNAQDSLSKYILTPKELPQPKINGAKVFGVRPGHPIIFTIPVTGTRPMVYSADHLPQGVNLDSKTGMISGSIPKPGEYAITLHAKNK